MFFDTGVSSERYKEPISKAMEIVREFFENEFGLLNAFYLDETKCGKYGFRAVFGLIVEFEPGKESNMLTLSRRLREETSPLTTAIYTIEGARLHLGKHVAPLLDALANNNNVHHYITQKITPQVFAPIHEL